MISKLISVYFQPKILTVLLLGFSSGLPRLLCFWTLSIWLTQAGVDLVSIGLFSMVLTPYSFKFLWSPLMDGAQFPLLCKWLGKRRGWLIATQLALIASILMLGFSGPPSPPEVTAVMALLVAFFSASQDIVIDAYRVEILKPQQQGAGAAAVVLGYRFGLIASGAGALFLSARIGWPATYMVMAALMGIGIVTALMNREPKRDGEQPETTGTDGSLKDWLREHVVDPFSDFMTRPQWLAVLLFIVLYKLGDAFMGTMTGPFYIKIGFTQDDIATYVKFYGIIATIVGSFIGGSMVLRLGATRSLWICGIAHMLTNLMFVVQARVGADLMLLATGITMENITSGMSTAAFVAFMSNLTHARYTATQYALLSSFAAFGATWLSSPAGWFAKMLGWEWFFIFSTTLAIPGLMVLWYLNRTSIKATSLPAASTSE